ncbi:hypothetical protein JCM5350_002609 [Sporobolomyces pararoseus]
MEMDLLSDHFASSLISANRQLEQNFQTLPSLTRASLSSLEMSFNTSLHASPSPETTLSLRKQSTPSRRLLRANQTASELPSFVTRPSPPPSASSSAPSPKPKIVRRHSWADTRSSRNEEEAYRRAKLEGLESNSSDEEENVVPFPPRRPSLHPLHRRVRSDPGPSSSISSGKRDLRRTLLKRRATLNQKSSRPSPPPSSPLPPPPRSRHSIETLQAYKFKTFSFPSTSSSPFLSPTPSSNSSFSSSSYSTSVSSRFSDDSSSEDYSSSASDTSESESEEDDEEEEFGLKTNAFDLELDLFPRPPSPPVPSQ